MSFLVLKQIYDEEKININVKPQLILRANVSKVHFLTKHHLLQQRQIHYSHSCRYFCQLLLKAVQHFLVIPCTHVVCEMVSSYTISSQWTKQILKLIDKGFINSD